MYVLSCYRHTYINYAMWFCEYVTCLKCRTLRCPQTSKTNRQLGVNASAVVKPQLTQLACYCWLKSGFLPGSFTPDTQHDADRRVYDNLSKSLFRRGLIHLSKQYTFACRLRQIPSLLAYKDTTRMTAHFRQSVQPSSQSWWKH